MKRKYSIILLWTSLGTTLFFFLFFNDRKDFHTFMMTLLLSTMYSFVLGFGNGFINEYLNKKFPWSEATRTRAVLSIISIIIGNFILVYFCNFMNYVVIQKTATIEDFFSRKYGLTNWFMINIALLITTFLHAKGFMEELRKSGFIKRTRVPEVLFNSYFRILYLGFNFKIT